MNRSFSYPAQFMFNTVNRLHALSVHPNLIVRLLARLTNRIAAKPISRRVGARHIVKAHLYGHSLMMPAEHPLATTLLFFPQFNRPLGLAIEAIVKSHVGDSDFAVIDVGANIGETVAILEQQRPGICSYLCIEADRDIAELCKLNHADNRRILVERCFIGENEGSLVLLEDDGGANPSTKLITDISADNEVGYDKLMRLDTVARPFAEAHGGLSLIKVDTEGYDFSVLRSASALLTQYKPSIYFEWFPKLLMGLNEEVSGGFEYLEELGYSHFVFFTNQGDYYCEISNPDGFFLRSLASVALKSEALGYFDVFASTSQAICKELVELSIAPDMVSPA
jgi:FkbM family methyltransferase